MNRDFPCDCKHYKKQHIKGIKLGYSNTTVSDKLICNVWDTNRLGIKNCKCTCFSFRPDNLKYLEQKYKENLSK